MTTIAIAGDQWLIDGEITYSGTRCEGLLMNARMVNCTFEDTHIAWISTRTPIPRAL